MSGRPRTLSAVDRWTDLDAVPADLGRTVVTLGTFDGVHVGHRAVLSRLVRRAHEHPAVPAVAITFDPHPVQVLFPERAPELITSLEQRLELLAEAGVEAVLVLEFTHELAQWSPQRFVEDVLVGRLQARTVVVGADTRFGHRNAGDVQTLRDLGQQHDFGVDVVDDLAPPEPVAQSAGASRRWSSSGVRAALAEGDVAQAARALGRPHRLTGVVVHGDHRGRELGYPTANLEQDAHGLVPADGVYAGWMVRPDHEPGTDRVLPAAVSIGTNPTFDGTQRRVEAYVLDRTDLDLYGERVRLELVERLRPTLRFDSVDTLVEQMRADVDRCREVLGGSLVPASFTGAGAAGTATDDQARSAADVQAHAAADEAPSAD
jgi:riboflavin kinase/FMN adenylyltransferase